ncbi:multidrug ABC transporter [Spirochaetia bacterium]|nr:multidrug ABC transporter [Spirochaetia bacterium]
MSIAQNVVRRPVLSIIVFSLVSILALYLTPKLAVGMFPDIDLPYLMVSTTYPGADPETVEKTVTRPLESALVNVSGLKQMKSVSQENASIVMLEFDFGSNVDAKMNRIRENIDLIRNDLPTNAKTPVVMAFDPLSAPVLRIALHGETHNQNELRSLAKDVLQDQLEQINGVAQATVEGGQDPIVRVALSQNRLEAYGVTISEIAGALAQQNMELGAGSITDGGGLTAINYAIRTAGEFSSLSDIAETVVTRVNGADIRLADIGEVAFGFADETSAVYINGEKGVYVSVMKQSGANSVAVANLVMKRLEKIKPLLPPDVTLEITDDNTVQTRAMLNELITSAIAGIALAMVVLLLFLRNINGTIIVGLSIPLSVLITMLAMSLAGITLNMMTLTGLILGLGMIVDSSIVVLENIYKFRERGEKIKIAAVLGGDEVISSIIASTLTTVCVFLPVYLFKKELGVMGVMLEGLIFTIIISLVSSLLVAVFLVPVLASAYLPLNSRTQKPVKNAAFAFFDRVIGGALDGVAKLYRRGLQAALQHKAITIILVIAAFAGSVLAISKMNMVLWPDTNADSVVMNVEMPLGTTYENTLAVMLQLDEYARSEIQGAKSITASVSTSGMSFTSQGSNTGVLNIKLDLENPKADTSKEVMRKLSLRWQDFPDTLFTFPATDVFSDPDIEITLYVKEVRAGFSEAQEIARIIDENLREVNSLAIDTNAGLPQVSVVIDRPRAYNFGLSVASVAAEIAASMNGLTATTLRYSGNGGHSRSEYNIILMLSEEDRGKIVDLDRIFVRSQNGALVPVSNFARLETGSGPVNISRIDQSRVITITGMVQEGYKVDETRNKIQALLDQGEYTYKFTGALEETEDMFKTFVMILTLALLLVFGVMAAQYESFKDPIINFCTIPLILIGVTAIHLITGQAVSMFTMMGFVMLAGIVVNNGIILVDYTNILVRRGVPVMDACLEAGETRLRPVLMTALTTILGVVPMAFFPGASATMTQPIGMAIIGGLTSATFITLFFIPVMYSIINRKRKAEKE